MLDIMAYLDPASNPESKPQSLSDRKMQKLHLEKQQQILEIFDQKPQKPYLQQKLFSFCFYICAPLSREIIGPLRKIKIRFLRKCAVLWLYPI